jgi:transketolase
MKSKKDNNIHKESSQIRTKLNFNINDPESSQRDAYASEITKIGKYNENIILLDADLMTVGKTHVFREEFPDRHIQVGIAEQNMIGIAAGLAQMGKLPITHSLAVFAIGRTFDQIKESVCYSELNVKMVGLHAGLTLGPDGATHQTMEDISLMASLPNMSVIAPADSQQVIDILPQVLENDRPTYIRLLFPNIPKTIEPNTTILGVNQILRSGNDLTVITSGQLVNKCLKAAEYLKNNNNLSIEVINVHTIKPFDYETILHSFERTRRGLVVEEHNMYGGIGSIVAYFTAKEHPTRIDYINTNDKFGSTGLPNDLLEAYGLDEGNIIKKIISILN